MSHWCWYLITSSNFIYSYDDLQIKFWEVLEEQHGSCSHQWCELWDSEHAEHASCSELDTDRGGTTPRTPATDEHTSSIWYPLRPGERCVRRCPHLSGWMLQGQIRMMRIYLLTSCHPNASPTTLCSQRRVEAWASPELTWLYSLSDHHFAILKARAAAAAICSCRALLPVPPAKAATFPWSPDLTEKFIKYVWLLWSIG